MMEIQILNLNFSSMKRHFKLLTLTLVLLVSGFLQAQIAHKGEPYQWKTKAVSLADIPGIVTEKLDMAAIQAEDMVVDQYKEMAQPTAHNLPALYGVFVRGTPSLCLVDPCGYVQR